MATKALSRLHPDDRVLDPRRLGVRAGRLTALDGLRGLSALVIAIVFHYQHFYVYRALPDPIWFANRLLHPLVEYGQMAVNLFFTISGFIFAHVYYDAVATQRIGAGRFFMLRFARLYPLHVAMTAAMAVLIYIGVLATGRLPLPDLGGSDGYHLLLNLVMLQHIGLQFGNSFNFVSWSLSVEAVCYCAFFCVARHVRGFELACVGLAVFGIYLLFNRVNTVLLCPEVGQGLFGFFAGCLIARGFEAGLWIPLTVAASTLVLVSLGTFALPGIAQQMVHAAAAYFTIQIVVLPALVVLALTIAPLRLVLSSRIARKLGDLSYSIYMVHISVQCVIIISASLLGFAVPYDRWWFYVIYVAAVLGSAEISHRTVEQPAQAWIRARYSGLH